MQLPRDRNPNLSAILGASRRLFREQGQRHHSAKRCRFNGYGGKAAFTLLLLKHWISTGMPVLFHEKLLYKPKVATPYKS